jgi:hypothetical protein
MGIRVCRSFASFNGNIFRKARHPMRQTRNRRPAGVLWGLAGWWMRVVLRSKTIGKLG